MIRKIVSILTVLIILSISVISFATTSQELNMQIQELNENINQNQGKINDIEKEKDSLTIELEKLNAEISAKEDEIEELTQELNELNDDITALEEQLQEQQKKYDEQYDLFCKRMVAQYKMGKVSYLDVLLNSKSLTDFISKYYIIEQLTEIPTGLNTLTVTAINSLNKTLTKTQSIKGNHPPKIDIYKQGNDLVVVITDEEGIDRIIQQVNVEKEQITNVGGAKEYTYKVPISADDIILIKITAIDVEGVGRTYNAKNY